MVTDAQFLGEIGADMENMVRELALRAQLQVEHLLVIGCSTSEVVGGAIGRAGTIEVAEQLFRAVQAVRGEIPFYPVFQCCEHLNRALVMERVAAERYGYEPVTVVPVARAGGSMAAYAFAQLQDAVVVETVRAHAGIDIGDTLIGMHLRAVAVPFRPVKRALGQAHVTAAFTRPKLIGGARAVYEK